MKEYNKQSMLHILIELDVNLKYIIIDKIKDFLKCLLNLMSNHYVYMSYKLWEIVFLSSMFICVYKCMCFVKISYYLKSSYAIQLYTLII